MCPLDTQIERSGLRISHSKVFNSEHWFFFKNEKKYFLKTHQDQKVISFSLYYFSDKSSISKFNIAKLICWKFLKVLQQKLKLCPITSSRNILKLMLDEKCPIGKLLVCLCKHYLKRNPICSLFTMF